MSVNGRPGTRMSNNSSASNLPRPISVDSSPLDSASLRKRQQKKDEAIRRKIENELGKKKPTAARARGKKEQIGSVMSLKPSLPLTVSPNITVSEASQLMAAKREDCVIVTDPESDVTVGIFTAKDLAFRVVAGELNPRQVLIENIMTSGPMGAAPDWTATTSLDLMVKRGFRHLPVFDEHKECLGVLDITKCFYDAMSKLERAYQSQQKLYEALQGVQSELGGTAQPPQVLQYFQSIRNKMSGPTLATVLDEEHPPVIIGPRTSVLQAAKLMRENHTTAVLIRENGVYSGIFTSKDVVLRVIAPGLDPATCSVIRVMTPHPDFAPVDMTIQAALRKMNDGHYLNLPVKDEDGEVIGVVDVLKLTYATLEQIKTMSTGDEEGPMWNKFWGAIDDEETASVASDSVYKASASVTGSQVPPLPPLAQSPPTSQIGETEDSIFQSPIRAFTQPVITTNMLFSYKFKTPKNKVHRFQLNPHDGVSEFRKAIYDRLHSERESVGGEKFHVSYVDDEGDAVGITSDLDLINAVELSLRAKQDKLDLWVHHPDEEAIPKSIEAVPPPILPAPTAVTPVEASEENDIPESKPSTAASSTSKHTDKQIIEGIPNELLLPGAILAGASAIILTIVIFGRGKR